MPRTIFLLAALLAGCTTIEKHERVEGWPKLQIVEHYVPNSVMRDKCAPYVGFGMSPEACAEFNLYTRTCHIWFSADFPPPRFIVEHERMHCAGYDHVGSSNMARFLEEHVARQGGSAAAGSSR